MAALMVDFVGGPADGQCMPRPNVSTVNVPVPGRGGFGTFTYTLRRCYDANGNVVEVLAPAGRPIDATWLAARNLTN